MDVNDSFVLERDESDEVGSKAMRCCIMSGELNDEANQCFEVFRVREWKTHFDDFKGCELLVSRDSWRYWIYNSYRGAPMMR